MQPLSPDDKKNILQNRPQAQPADIEEYERLLSLRFSEDPDTKPKGGMVSDLEFQSHLDSRTKLNERLRELHQKLFGP